MTKYCYLKFVFLKLAKQWEALSIQRSSVATRVHAMMVAREPPPLLLGNNFIDFVAPAGRYLDPAALLPHFSFSCHALFKACASLLHSLLKTARGNRGTVRLNSQLAGAQHAMSLWSSDRRKCRCGERLDVFLSVWCKKLMYFLDLNQCSPHKVPAFHIYFFYRFDHFFFSSLCSWLRAL